MKFFIDTAKVEDIREANDMGVICGVTTNPSLIAKEGRDSVSYTHLMPLTASIQQLHLMDVYLLLRSWDIRCV